MLKETLQKHTYFLLALIVAVEVITFIPVLFGIFFTPRDFYFTGVNSLYPEDFHVYFSYFEQVKQGNWLFEDLYTGERQTANLLNPFFLLFGLIGKFLHFSNIATFQLARALMIPVFLIVLMMFLRLFFSDRKKLYGATLLAVFGSGIGAWIAPFFWPFSYIDSTLGYFHWPMDLWTPEFNTFLTLYRNPLYTASLTLILLVFIFFVKSLEEQKIRWSILAGLFGFLLFLIHPYHIPTIYIISGLWVLAMILKKQLTIFSAIKHWGVFFLLSAPSAVYQILLLFTDPIMGQRYSNTGGPPTVLWLTIIAYGFLLFFALPEMWRCARTILNKKSLSVEEQRFLFLILWFSGGMLLIYAPFFKHTRRLTEGLQIPLVIFTTLFLFRQMSTSWYQKFQKTDMRFIAFSAFTALIVLFGMSTLYVLNQDIRLFQQKSPEIYISKQTKDAMDWIKSHTTNEDVILADLLIGNRLPGIAGRHVYIGHTAETALYRLKERWFFVFFAKNRDDMSESRFLSENRISYIFYTDALKDLGNWRPENKSYLRQVYRNDDVIVLKVLPR